MLGCGTPPSLAVPAHARATPPTFYYTSTNAHSAQDCAEIGALEHAPENRLNVLVMSTYCCSIVLGKTESQEAGQGKKKQLISAI